MSEVFLLVDWLIVLSANFAVFSFHVQQWVVWFKRLELFFDEDSRALNNLARFIFYFSYQFFRGKHVCIPVALPEHYVKPPVWILWVFDEFYYPTYLVTDYGNFRSIYHVPIYLRQIYTFNV